MGVIVIQISCAILCFIPEWIDPASSAGTDAWVHIFRRSAGSIIPIVTKHRLDSFFEAKAATFP